MKKKLDSISRTSVGTPADAATSPAQEADPVVETIAAHQAAAATPKVDVPVTPSAQESAPVDTTTPPTGVEAAPPLDKADNFETLFPEPSVSISSPPSWVWWLVLLVMSLILAGTGYALARKKINGWLSLPTATPVATTSKTAAPKSTATPSSTATPTPTATPTATPSSTAQPFTLRVLNGTTKNGAAAAAEGVLEKAGFTVGSIGNAHNQTYTETVIYYATGQTTAAEEVQKALTGYDATLEESTTVASPSDVLVVVG